MDVFVQMKCVGKKRKGLEKVPYVLPDGISTLRELIDVITRQEVAAYNARGTDNMLVNFLTDESIAAKATVGKVEFGRLYSENKADPDKSSQAAIQGFEDGLFRVLVGETEASELDGQVSIKDGDTLTFIRLAFLAGRLW